MSRSLRVFVLTAFCAGMFVWLTAPSISAQGVLPDILKRMDDNNKSLKSLKANLKMSKYNSQLDEYDVYEGSVQYIPSQSKEKIRVRIDWEKPAVEHLAVGGGKYILYRPRLEQAIIGSVDDAGGGAGASGPLAFLSMSRAQLRRNYDVTYKGEETVAGTVGAWHLLLTPNTAAKFKTADLWVDTNGMPVQAKITEKNNDTTTIVLSGVDRNATVKADAFAIKPPKNTKIIQG